MSRLALSFVLLVSLLMPRHAVAQAEATIAGGATDESKAVLPGVTVTVVDVATGRTHVAVTDASGEYRLRVLPGTYRVQAELSGFATAVIPTVELLVGQAARLGFVLKVAALAETISVTGQAPLVDVSSSEVAGNVDRRQMENLPISGRNWLELSMMVKGITANSIDQRPGVNTDDQFQLNLDGQQVTQKVASSGFGQPKFSREAIAEFQIVTSLFDITQGRSTGIQVQAISRSGTNNPSGSVYGYFRNDAFNAADHISGTVLPFKNQQLGATFGGPIIRDRLHYFGSYEFEREPATLLVRPAQLPNQSWQFPSTTTQHNFLGRADYTLSSKDTLSARGTYWGLLNPFSVGSGAHPSQALRRERYTWNVQGTWTRVLNAQAVQEVKLGYNSFGWEDTLFYDKLLEPTSFGTSAGSPTLVFPGISIGGVRDNPLAHYQHLPSVTYGLTWTAKKHDIRIGGEWLPWYDDGYWNFRRRGEFVFSSMPSDLERRFPADAFADPSRWDLSGLNGTVTRFDINVVGQEEGWNFDVPRKTWALWFGDNWRVSDRLTLNLGVRWDADWGGLAPPGVPADTVFTPFGATPLFKTDIRDLDNVAPRVGFVYAIGSNNSFAIRGGMGLYYNFPFSNVTYSQQSFNGDRVIVNSLPNTGAANFIQNPLGNLTLEDIAAKRVPLPAQAPRAIAHDFEDMYARQSSIGFQKQLGASMGLEMDLHHSKESNLTRGRDINLLFNPATGYNIDPAVARPDPNFGEVTWMESTGASDYLGLETALTRRFTGMFQAGLTYTHMFYKHDNTTSFLIAADNQFDLDADWARSTDFQRHTLRTNAMLRLPWNISVAGIFFAGSGNYYATTVAGRPYGKPGTNRLNTGAPIVIPEAVRDRVDGLAVIDRNQTVPRNALRGEPLYKLDFRVTKAISLGRGIRADAIAEVFNLLDHANFGAYNGQVNSTTFGQPQQNTGSGYVPRSGQLALRLVF